MSDEGMRETRLVLVAVAAACAILAVESTQAAAQVGGPNLEIGWHARSLHLSEFDLLEFASGLYAERSLPGSWAIGGSVSFFPGDRQLRHPGGFLDRSRVLGLVGIRGGPRRLRWSTGWGRVQPQAHARAGFLRFNDGDPDTCILIVPTPLACRLASGYTAFAAEIGAGADIGLNRSERLRLRLDASDLLVRYGLQATRGNGETTDGFINHNLLVTIALGWRF
jgi:hypothetical protein